MPLMNETEIKKLLKEALAELERCPLDHDCELARNVYNRWKLEKKLAEYIAKLS